VAERNASLAVVRSELLDIQTMRLAAAAVLAPDAYPRHGELEAQRLLLRRHINQLISVLEDIAPTRPAESVPAAVALAEAESARVLLNTYPEPGLRGAVQHLRHLARELRALCDHHDVLTGDRPLGGSISVGQLATVSWCEACCDMAEDVQRVQLPGSAPRPEWGTHACHPCRQRLGLTAARREPGRAVRTR
jgi:hypothetical protein